jgi:glycosyltransferase involved in cell wall biosynthesis
VRVGIDHHVARTQAPGVGRYSRELVRALVRLDQCPELLLLDAGRGARSIGEPALGLADAPRPPRVVSSRLPRRLFKVLHGSADRALGGVDLFHRMLPAWPPVARARQVLGVSELFEPGSQRDRELAAALAEADALVFSDATARALRARYGVPPQRIHRVPVGADHWLRDLPARPPPKLDPPQLLVLGGLHPRRRPERVLRAVEALHGARRPVRLLFVAARNAHSEAFLRQHLAGSAAAELVLLDHAAGEGDMARILAASSCLVHLSAGEETAVTPLEGAAFDLPVVASRVPAFEEDLGEAAELVDPAAEEDPKALAGAIERALDGAADPARRAARAAAAARCTWAANAAATVAVYRRLCG